MYNIDIDIHAYYKLYACAYPDHPHTYKKTVFIFENIYMNFCAEMKRTPTKIVNVLCLL